MSKVILITGASSGMGKETAKQLIKKNPKIGYRVGKFAKPLVWLCVYLGDKLFDKIILSQVK